MRDAFKEYAIKDKKDRKFLEFTNERWYEEFLQLLNSDTVFDPTTFFWKGVPIERRDDYRNDLGNQWKYTVLEENDLPTLEYVYKYVDKISKSEVILDGFLKNEFYLFASYIYRIKYSIINDCFSEYREENFVSQILPLFRLMDYCTKKKALRHLGCILEVMEKEYILLWLEINSKEFEKLLQENKTQPELLYMLPHLPKEFFTKYLTREHINVFDSSIFEAVYILFQVKDIPEDDIEEEFFESFRKLDIYQQVSFAEVLQEKEYSRKCIERLHSLFNKCLEKKDAYNLFEMSPRKVRQFISIIGNSSYLKKNEVPEKLWRDLKYESYFSVSLEFDYYKEIMNLYDKCRNYANESIVNALYPLNNLTQEVTYIPKGQKYNILARVRTDSNGIYGLKKVYKNRTFCSYSIITEKNHSRYKDDVLYGYYTGVTPNMIAHIFPKDSLSIEDAKFEYCLSRKCNKLLDIYDLNNISLVLRTYCELCIRTTTNSGEVLFPDCIVCFGDVDSKSQNVAKRMRLKIVVVPNECEVENVGDYYVDVF